MARLQLDLEPASPSTGVRSWQLMAVHFPNVASSDPRVLPAVRCSLRQYEPWKDGWHLLGSYPSASVVVVLEVQADLLQQALPPLSGA